MCLETLYFCWFDRFFWIEHRDGIPVFFSERIGSILDMVTRNPRGQETCIIDKNDWNIEFFPEIFQYSLEVSYITRTCDNHSNMIFCYGVFDDGLCFPIRDREEESLFFVRCTEFGDGLYEKHQLTNILMLVFTIYRDERDEFLFFLKGKFAGIRETTIPLCTERSFCPIEYISARVGCIIDVSYTSRVKHD